MRDSVIEIFREDVRRCLGDLHTADNGTVWRWNRPCQGLPGWLARLRIEPRALPAGPTVADEVANAAFALGMIHSYSAERLHAPDRLRFDGEG